MSLPTVLVNYFLKIKKEYKNLNKPEIEDTFIQTNQIKPGFNMVYFTRAIPRADKSFIKSEIMKNQHIAEGIQKPLITKSEKRKVCLCFRDNIWGADLADINK